MVRKIEEETRKRRQSGNTKETLEMMVYVDKSAVDFHGSSRVESYVMNMLNIVSVGPVALVLRWNLVISLNLGDTRVVLLISSSCERG